MEFVDVLDAGNLQDPLNSGSAPGIGVVGYAYRIGKYEVTNAQYAAFLNAVAAADPNELYNAGMGSFARGGITRSGASPNFTYEVKLAMGDKPINYVGWYDAVRFCNWLHNGKPTGPEGPATTEDGAYDLSVPPEMVTRASGARYFLPTHDEWYKAAYYEPGGDTDGYWAYPTRGNGAPNASVPPGTAPAANTEDAVADLTDVGAYATSPTFYGTFDMAGNASEWTEANIETGNTRGARGGRWNAPTAMAGSSQLDLFSVNERKPFTGFRVVSP